MRLCGAMAVALLPARCLPQRLEAPRGSGSHTPPLTGLGEYALSPETGPPTAELELGPETGGNPVPAEAAGG